MALTAKQQKFVADLLEQGAPVARSYLLPVSAMLACAGAECSFGEGSIFEKTGCPFNLQKPKLFTWIKCETILLNTINKPGEAAKPAPFCKTKTLAEAADVWCSWIVNWPYKPNRERILKYRFSGEDFTRLLPIVGFAANDIAKGEDYVKVRTENGFAVHDWDIAMIRAFHPLLKIVVP